MPLSLNEPRKQCSCHGAPSEPGPCKTRSEVNVRHAWDLPHMRQAIRGVEQFCRPLVFDRLNGEMVASILLQLGKPLAFVAGLAGLVVASADDQQMRIAGRRKADVMI